MEAKSKLSALKSKPILAKAQEELGQMDIIICGKCHMYFPYAEEFLKHRESCQFIANFKSDEISHMVWGFLLWKGALLTKNGQSYESSKKSSNSYKIYQDWLSLPEAERISWIEAGKNLQRHKKLSKARIQAVQDSATSTEEVVMENKCITDRETTSNPDFSKPRPDLQETNKKTCVKTTENNVRNEDKKESKLDTKPDIEKTEVQNCSTDFTVLHEMEQTSIDKCKRKIEELHIEPINKPEEFNKNVNEEKTKLTTKKTNSNRHQLPNKREFSIDEFAVEKIVAKRYNPKKKCYEYLLKWEGYTAKQSTWEPSYNLLSCTELVSTFEKNLAKQKLNHQKQKDSESLPNPKLLRNYCKATAVHVDSNPCTENVKRPVRSSKKKALAQVKSWCGTIESSPELKRRRISDSDSDEDLSRTNRYWAIDECCTSGDEISGPSSQDDVLSYTISDQKKNVFQTCNKLSSNLAKKNTINMIRDNSKIFSESSVDMRGTIPFLDKADSTQSSVLVANSKGIIAVDASHASKLSSGVYVIDEKNVQTQREKVFVNKLQSHENLACNIPKSPTSFKPAVSCDRSKITSQNSFKQSPVYSRGLVRVLPKPQVNSSNNGFHHSLKLSKDIQMVPHNNVNRLVHKSFPAQSLQTSRTIFTSVKKTYNNVSSLRSKVSAVNSKMQNHLVRQGNAKRPIQTILGKSNFTKFSPNFSNSFKTENFNRLQLGKYGKMPNKSMNIIQDKNQGSIIPQVELELKQENPLEDKMESSEITEMDYCPGSSGESENDYHPRFPNLDNINLEPESPLPFSLCPVTGKILSQAEGEPTPHLTPEEPVSFLINDSSEQKIVKTESVSADCSSSFVNQTSNSVDALPGECYAGTVSQNSELNMCDIKSSVTEDASQKLFPDGSGNCTDIITITSDMYDLSASSMYVNQNSTDPAVLTIGNNVTSFVTEEEINRQVSCVPPGQQLVMASIEGIPSFPGFEDRDQQEPGKRRVILLLPDGNVVVADVDAEQYAALNEQEITYQQKQI